MNLKLMKLMLDGEDEATELKHNLKLFYFRNIRNANELLNLITESKGFPNCTCLDASKIISQFHVELACTKAYLNQFRNTMRTKSIYTEILMSFSPTVSIVDSFKNFGILSGTKDIFVIIDVEDNSEQKIIEDLKNCIDGEFAIPDFSGCQEENLRKVFKLSNSINLAKGVFGGMAAQCL